MGSFSSLFFGRVSNNKPLQIIDNYSGIGFNPLFLGKVSNSKNMDTVRLFQGYTLWPLRKLPKERLFFGKVIGGENSFSSMQTLSVVQPPTFKEKISIFGVYACVQFPDIGQYKVIPSADIGMVNLQTGTNCPIVWTMELCNHTGKYTHPDNEWTGIMDKGKYHLASATRKFLLIILCAKLGDGFCFLIFPRLVIKSKPVGLHVLSMGGVDDISDALSNKVSITSYVAEEALIKLSARKYLSTTLTRNEKSADTEVMVNYQNGTNSTVPTGETVVSNSETFDLPTMEQANGTLTIFTLNISGTLDSITEAYYIQSNTQEEITLSGSVSITGNKQITFSSAPEAIPNGSSLRIRGVQLTGTIVTPTYSSVSDDWKNHVTLDTTTREWTFDRDIESQLPVVICNPIYSNELIDGIMRKAINLQGENVVKEYIQIDYKPKPFKITSELHCQRQPLQGLVDQVLTAGALEYVIDPTVRDNLPISTSELPYFKNTFLVRKTPLFSEYPEISNWKFPEELVRQDPSISSNNIEKSNTVSVIKQSVMVMSEIKKTYTVYSDVTKQIPKPAPSSPTPTPGSFGNNGMPVTLISSTSGRALSIAGAYNSDGTVKEPHTIILGNGGIRL